MSVFIGSRYSGWCEQISDTDWEFMGMHIQNEKIMRGFHFKLHLQQKDILIILIVEKNS